MKALLNSTYVFTCSCSAKSKSEGSEKLLPVIERCEKFADSMQISIFTDMPQYHRRRSHSRFTFTMRGKYDTLPYKLQALFYFASKEKLSFTDGQPPEDYFLLRTLLK